MWTVFKIGNKKCSTKKNRSGCFSICRISFNIFTAVFKRRYILKIKINKTALKISTYMGLMSCLHMVSWSCITHGIISWSCLKNGFIFIYYSWFRSRSCITHRRIFMYYTSPHINECITHGRIVTIYYNSITIF